MLTDVRPLTVGRLRQVLVAARELPGCGRVTLDGDLLRAESAPFRDGGEGATVSIVARVGLLPRTKPVSCALRDLRRVAKAPAGCALVVRGAELVALPVRPIADTGAVAAAVGVTAEPPAVYRDNWLMGVREGVAWPDVVRVAHAASRETAGRPALAGVMAGPGGMVATDSYRIAALGAPAGGCGWVPTAAVRALAALRADPATVVVGRTWAGTPDVCVAWTRGAADTGILPRVVEYCEDIRAAGETCTVGESGAGQLRQWARPRAEVEAVELHADGATLVLVPFVDGRPVADVDAGTMVTPSPRRVLCRVNPGYLADALEFTEGAALRIQGAARPLGAVRGDAVAVMMPQRAS